MRFSLIFIFAFLVMFVQIHNTEAFGAKKGIVNVARKIGGSGKPRQHFIVVQNRKAALTMATNAGKGPAVHHTAHEPGQYPHFHPTDRKGNIIKDGSHYMYPKKTG